MIPGDDGLSRRRMPLVGLALELDPGAGRAEQSDRFAGPIEGDVAVLFPVIDEDGDIAEGRLVGLCRGVDIEEIGPLGETALLIVGR